VITHLQKLSAVLVIVVASAGIGSAQDKSTSASAKAASTAPAPTAAAPTVPLRIQVVISRYEGDKKISSLPYVLSVTAGRTATLRMGTKVPVESTSYTPIATGGAGVNPLTSYTYSDVGTNIDCGTTALDDGRFKLELTVEDSSVEDQARGAIDRPSFRSFRGQNSLVLKDGQTTQFTTAVDKVSGVVTKVDVLLTVVK
jgi:hypothetical protein